jgi:SPP1 family predicted phage head-tail adaptor
MPYRAGELSERVTFRREATVDDGMGGTETSWQDIATVWALVRPMSGRERERADRVDAEANYLIVVRERADLTEKDVAVWRGRQLNLRFIKYRPRELYLEIEAEIGVAV